MLFVDLPGYGNSKQDSSAGFTFMNAAVGIIELIENLSPHRKVILIAHSYGGLVVKKVLSQIPEKIDKIVVGSTNVRRSPLFCKDSQLESMLIKKEVYGTVILDNGIAY